MAIRFTPTPTPSNTPTISLTPSITPTITPSLTSCPYVCCYNSGFTIQANTHLSNLFQADDNNILIGGALGSGQYQGNSLAGRQILRIDACGNFIQAYPSPGGIGDSSASGGFAKQSNGKIIVAGSRTVWRLNADYSVDTTFTSGQTLINRGILGVGVNSQDEILIVGNFSSTTYTTSGGSVSFNTNIYKLSKDGVPDTSYSGKSLTWVSPGSEDFDNRIIKDPDGKFMIVGYDAVNGDTNYQGIVRFNDDFSLDTTFRAAGFSSSPNPGRFVLTSYSLPNGQYLVGGAFQNYSGFSNQDFLIRLNNNGTLDTTFDFGNDLTNQYVFDIQVQSTGKIIVADSGVRVIRLNSNGAVDTTFVSGTTTSTNVYNDTVLLTLPNDDIIVGGSYDTYNTLPFPKMVKLESNGTLDMCPFPSPTPTMTPTQTNTPTRPIISPTPTSTATPTFTPTPSITPPSGELFVYAKYRNAESVLQYQINYGAYDVIGNIDSLSCDYIYTITGLTAGDVIYLTTYSGCILAYDTSSPCPNSGFACDQTYNFPGGTNYIYITVDGSICC